jgi:DNA sulfur modification protein DndE
MNLNRIRVCVQADNYLRQLKGRTGLTPNLLCRIGFCLSLREMSAPNPDDYTDNSTREFNRYTLTGPWDNYFVALLRERLFQEGLSPDQLESQFIAHINRGVILLFQRVKSVNDIARLVEEAQDFSSHLLPISS